MKGQHHCAQKGRHRPQRLFTFLTRLGWILWTPLGVELTGGAPAYSLDWVPSNQEIHKYRQSWDPL